MHLYLLPDEGLKKPLSMAHQASVADSTWASSCPFNKHLLACSAKGQCASKRCALQHKLTSSVENSDWACYLLLTT
jgi:hypothetical protein